MRYVIESLTTPTCLLSARIILFLVFLIIYHAILKKKNRPMGLWRVLCFVPLAGCVIHALFYNFGKQEVTALFYFGTMYMVAILIAVWQFFCNAKIIYRIFACIIMFCSLCSYVYIPAGAPLPTNLHCYTYQGWTESFVSTVRCMEKEYVLSQWKGIDYDALIEEFVPRIEEAEKNNDITELGVILYDYCNRFYDGHTYLTPANADIAGAVNQEIIGNDYGLSLITLHNGDVVAIQVEPKSEAEQYGIHTGTVITKWNHVPVDEAKYSFELPVKPPVEENEEPTRTMLLAGKGGDTISVSFITNSGEEKTVTLKRMGDYAMRYSQTYAQFCNLVGDDENFSYKMISDSCGYLRINAENLGVSQTVYAIFAGEAPFISSKVDQILEDLKSQGMTELVIDIRNNIGGYPQVSTAVASLFTEEEKVYYYDHSKIENNGNVVQGEPFYIRGNGKWSDLPTVVLVNQKTVSSGDALAELLSACPNVTLMGMTPSNCSFQSIGGESYLAEGYFTIYYPVVFCTEEEGNPFIDTDTSRESRIPLEVQIPIDEVAVEVIFGANPQDYELNYAIDWLNQ